MTTDSGPARTVEDVARELLASELSVEREKKASIESRAFAVITSTGALVTLLLGLAAIVTESRDYTAPPVALILFSVAAVLFVSAAVVAIYCNAPSGYEELDATSLAALLAATSWLASGSEASREVLIAQLQVLQGWRVKNEKKALVLALAAACEVTAIISAAAATLVVLAHQ